MLHPKIRIRTIANLYLLPLQVHQVHRRWNLARILSQGEGLPWQVNKIILYLQVFAGNSLSLQSLT